MKHLKSAIFLMTAILLSSCSSYNIGVQKHTGFTELPFPSNTYQPGQIVEIFSSPRKVEITFDPQIPWDMASISEGWNISSSDISSIKSMLEIEIRDILSTNASYNKIKKIQVEFTNTKTRVIPKNKIFSALYKSINEDNQLKNQLQIYMKSGTNFDVITQTLNANISFKALDQSNQEIELDSEAIKKLNTEFDINFSRQSGSSRIVSGSNLTIGFHYDTKMITLLVK